METHERGTTTLRSTQPNETPRRIILFPLPFQGHINPMLQLANILHTQGFKITIMHTEFNSPNYSNYPHFTFESIKDRFSEIQHQLQINPVDASYFLMYLNRSCVEPFRDSLVRLMAESDKESIACVITDAVFFFTQAVADDLNLPRMVLGTSSLGCTLVYNVLPFSSKEGCFYITKEGFLEDELDDDIKLEMMKPGKQDDKELEIFDEKKKEMVKNIDNLLP